ncbi:vWA domain-containing protein [Streptomyces celluloflavus]|uniref:VWA domain-containing protein n=1 Tax=Streptomyces celluloflavus TaxID=58344 RepID=A0ABW7RK56_9ACTN|nr:VWA domain-containing protein [Streptomyces celluloflavus]
MGIRSLLRNAFGRSKATREETGGAPSGADAPESATIPEAREESAPGAVTPEAEVPAARTAPSESPKPDRAPKTATLPAQGSPVDIGAAKSHLTHSGAGDNSGSGSSSNSSNSLDKADDAKADAVTVPAPAEAPEAVKAVEEPAPTAPEPEVTTTADLVSQAFDNPAPVTAPASEPAAPSSEPAAETAKPTAAPEAKPETKPEAKPEATTTPETNLEAAAEPVSAPEPIPTAEPKTESKTEPKPEPKTESAAKSAAEPTAEPTAEAAPEPQSAPETDSAPHEDETPAPAAAPSATSPDASSPLSRLESTAPGLVSLYTSAGATLEKHGLATQRAIVYLVLDRSGSMRNYYKDGTVQHLAEQALGLSAHLDDGTVPVVFFSTDVDGTADLDLANHQGRIEELHAGLGHMGRTNYHWAITEVVDHYKKSGATAPAFVIFQTDGAPTSKPAAEKALCEAAGLPVFWQFIGFGDPDAKGFDFLRKLDDLTVPDRRAVDNAGFFHAGRDPRSLSADEFYQQLMVEFPEWLAEARTAGVLKDN